MATNTQEYNSQEPAVDQGEQIQRLLYRILPFWPLIILTLALGIVGARVYLRYQVPIYAAKARVVVNDETQQKSANLQEIIKLDTRNLSSETEREMQVLSSRDLLTKLAVKLQLNIMYIQQGLVRTAQYYDENLPFQLELQNPESIKSGFSGKADLVGNQVKFEGVLYPMDSFVASRIGVIKWVKNNNANITQQINSVQINIVPIRSAVSQLKSALRVTPISKQSSILDLIYYDAVPARGVNILENLISIYGSSSVDYKSLIYANAKTFLDGRLRLVEDELSGVEKDLQAFKTSSGIVDLSREGEIYISQSKDNLRKLGEIEVQQDVLREIEKYVVQRNTSNSGIPATLGLTDPVLINLMNQLYQAETELQKTKQISGEKNPQIEVYEGVIAKLKQSLLKSIDNLKINLAASKSQLQSEYNQMVGSLNKIPVKERLLLDITRQQAVKNAIYTFLLQKREESAIAAASVLPNYRLIEKAEAGGIVSPEPKKAYTVGVLISLMLVAVYIYFREFARKRILFRAQIEGALENIPVISELVYYSHNPLSPIVVGAGKRTLIAEQFRELRTNINYITASATDKCKVVLTTSSIPKEGKSFVAINAAISISLTGDRVVLLEFDLRKPKISKPLGITRDPGLSNYLIGKSTVDDIIKPHATIENL